MPKMKDLGINVIPETMRPPECLPMTVGPVCHPGGYTFEISTATCIPNSCGVLCGCTRVTNPCLGCTHIVTLCATHTTITICYTGSICANSFVCPGGSICTGGTEPTIITITPTTPQIHQGGGLTRESIAQLKEQLQQQISQLDEYAKSVGPRTADEIDAREKQLKAELDDLSSRRSDLKKSK